jgi:HEAT repeat protein
MTNKSKLIFTSLGLVILPIFIVLAFYAQAASPEDANASTTSVLEVLSQPEERKKIDQLEKNPYMYSNLMNVAFSEHHSVPMRWRALILGAQIKKEASVGDLQKAMSHKEWFLRNAALVAMKEVSQEHGQEAALKLITDKALVIRSAAVKLLEKEETAPIRKILWSELNRNYNFRKTQSLWVRSEILAKLSNHPQAIEMNQFVKALRDNDERLHSPAIVALEKLTQKKLGTEKSAVPELRNLWLDWSNKNGLAL